MKIAETTIYQITFTEAQVDEVNSGKVVPAFEAKMKTQVFGADKFESSMFQYYAKVGTVYTDSLEEAFRSANANVGDIFRQEDRYYMVENFGFRPLYFFNDEIDKKL